jgi:RecB family endonuclease NucS
VAARNATALLAIASLSSLHLPGNYYAIIQAEHGETELREIIDKNPQLKVLRMYKLCAEDKELAFQIVAAYGREDDGTWYIPRLNDMVFDLDMNFEVVKAGPSL